MLVVEANVPFASSISNHYWHDPWPCCSGRWVWKCKDTRHVFSRQTAKTCVRCIQPPVIIPYSGAALQNLVHKFRKHRTLLYSKEGKRDHVTPLPRSLRAGYPSLFTFKLSVLWLISLKALVLPFSLSFSSLLFQSHPEIFSFRLTHELYLCHQNNWRFFKLQQHNEFLLLHIRRLSTIESFKRKKLFISITA